MDTVERTGRALPSAVSLGRVNESMKLAEQLGAATLSLTGEDIVAVVADYCGKNNVTQLVIGKSISGGCEAMAEYFGRPGTGPELVDQLLGLVLAELRRGIEPLPGGCPPRPRS